MSKPINGPDLTQFSYEELAHALYTKGKRDGYHKVTDKTKWREAVTAEKLGHVTFKKISAGKNSDKYGADADNPVTGKKAEYKSQALEEAQINNLLQRVKSAKTGSRYAPLTVGGVYNGAYSHEAVDRYLEHEHYFGIFYEERCLMIIRPRQETVIDQLRSEIDRRKNSNKGGSTNLNTVRINLGDKHLYDVAWKDEDWFKQHE
jgi:hypothetical protein